MQNRLRFLVIMALLSFTVMVIAQDTMTAITTHRINIRTAPGTTSPRLDGIDMNTLLVVEARNERGDWLLVHTQDTLLRGWAAAEFLILQNGEIAKLPVSTERIGGTPTASDTVSPAPINGQITAIAQTDLRVRAAPTLQGEIVGRLALRTEVIIEGRSNSNEWVLMHTFDNSVRGWVAARYLAPLNDTTLATLPILEEVFSAPIATTSVDSAPIAVSSAPTTNYITIGSRSAQIFRQGQRLGNRANAFMKIGDSVTVEEWFLQSFGQGDYELGAYGYLQPTIDFFNASGSFTRVGVAAYSGLNAAGAVDSIWADKSVCKETETVVECEYRLRKPAIAFIYFFGNDVLAYSPADFSGYIRKIVNILTQRGVIPVLTTPGVSAVYFPDRSPHYIQAIRNLANEQGLPLIDLYNALQGLPGQGVYDPEYHLTLRRDGVVSFNSDQNIYGATVRELLSLQLLDLLRVQVMGR